MIPLFMNIAQDYDNNSFLYDNDSRLLSSPIVHECYDPSLPKTMLNFQEDKNASKIYTCNFVEQQVAINKWVDLYKMFEKSFKKHANLFSEISSDKISSDFNKSLRDILTILPETVSAGVSDDECVYIYFEKDNKSVYFDMFFEQEHQTEVSVTIFENKISKFSFTDYLDNSIKTLKNKFATENELSFSPFAEI